MQHNKLKVKVKYVKNFLFAYICVCVMYLLVWVDYTVNPIRLYLVHNAYRTCHTF